MQGDCATRKGTLVDSPLVQTTASETETHRDHESNGERPDHRHEVDNQFDHQETAHTAHVRGRENNTVARSIKTRRVSVLRASSQFRPCNDLDHHDPDGYERVSRDDRLADNGVVTRIRVVAESELWRAIHVVLCVKNAPTIGGSVSAINVAVDDRKVEVGKRGHRNERQNEQQKVGNDHDSVEESRSDPFGALGLGFFPHVEFDAVPSKTAKKL